MINDQDMPACFIIQPFDNGGRYDKRYGDVFEPAVRKAGLEPYRVDHDPGVSVPIERIEEGIRSAAICLADISLDNPNVWFELGYAIATERAVVMLCSDERTTPYPFDVQHRTVLKYSTESERDYRKLRSDIVKRLRALLKAQRADMKPHEARVDSEPPRHGSSILVPPDSSLSEHDMAGLTAVLEGVGEVEEEIGLYRFRNIMHTNGFTGSAATVALRSLIERKMLSRDTYLDENGEECVTYHLTKIGMEWVLANSDKFPLWRGSEEQRAVTDDLPF